MSVSGEILIDGSQGEGGGQILRTSLALAAALSRAVRIVNIRANRKPPGLRPQHLAAVRAAAAVCGAGLAGAEVGASELLFRPGPVRGGRYEWDIGTAGSTSLVLQTVLPPLALCGEDAEVVVRGGTHNRWAPCFHYLRDVFGVLAAAMNVQTHFEMRRAGFYPAGGGEVVMHVRGLDGPRELGPIRMNSRGELKRTDVLSAASSSLPEHIVQRQAQQARRRLAEADLPGELPDVRQERWETYSPGTAVFVRAVFAKSVAGFDALGERGKPAERVADEAADGLLAFLSGQAALDSHAADQVLTLAALCPGETRFTSPEITSHLQTNAAVIRQMTGREVELTTDEKGTGQVRLAARM